MKKDGGPLQPISLRDHLAINAPPRPSEWWPDDFPQLAPRGRMAELGARWRYAYADAMIAERDK